MGYKITIDGPAASGKGYAAKEVSNALGILNVDTGAMYRAVALYCINNSIAVQDIKDIPSLEDIIDICLKKQDDNLKVYLNNEDVTDKIRTKQIDEFVAKVAQIPCVREYVKSIQRKIAMNNNVIIEGRDIGSVVFPEAELKIFLTADVSVRAQRRYKDMIARNIDMTYEEVLEAIKRRDEKDINREVSPLVKTDDMILIDTTSLSREQVVNKILGYVKEKGLV